MGALGATGLLGKAGLSEASNGALGNVPTQVADVNQTSPDLTKWIDEVPRPGVLKAEKKKNGKPLYEVEMCEVEQQLHSELPPTTVWGYEGQYPGPTIEAKQGKDVYVKWKNNLPKEHLLPVDTTLHGAAGTPEVRTVTHLHGANVEPESDGGPEAWFTQNFEEVGPTFEKKTYWYANEQPETSLWYHDHALGITRLNVYAGLAGFYFLRGKLERKLDLPKGKYEIPLVFQDRTFNEDGSLFYPTGPEEDTGEPNPNPSVVPEFFGDTSVVNGKAWPKLTVEPRKYRFRTLNGANSRFYNLKLFEYDQETGEIGDPGPTMTQIGSDGGFLKEPVEIQDRLLLGPAFRADLIVDFSDFKGQTLLLHNNAPSPFGGVAGEDPDDVQPLPEVLLIDVKEKNCKRDKSCIPNKLARIPELKPEKAVQERELPLVEGVDEFDRLKLLLGTREHPNGLEWSDPITEDPKLGTTEIWDLINTTVDTHPIHLHLVQFQVLGRRPFDVDQYNADRETGSVGPISDYYTGPLEAPPANQRGWKDTIDADPGFVTKVIAHFGEFKGLFKDFTGEYPWHCHILEHEDHEMMRPYEVLPREDKQNDNGC
ncbi:spore coat protein A [Haladaptatus litoreus]|uniref:Spore coat protein A n=2 Tax=Haladaptatus litoreus TaxID=553468 RepID=A0A1N7CUA6_9EURY|nr:spore coat protein A [Haladaptatus litoreus]